MNVGSLTRPGARYVLAALVMLACARTGWAAGPRPTVLLYRPEAPSTHRAEPDSGASWMEASGGPRLPASVRVSYPTGGQSGYGACWLGLEIDSAGTLYPGNSLGVYRLLPDGTLVNGVEDTNLFINGPPGIAVLEERTGRFFAYGDNKIFDAPFLEGSTFSPLLTGLTSYLVSIEVGRGALAGSLFVAHSGVPRITRVTLSPLVESSVFVENELFAFPLAMASAPDGTLYVVTQHSSAPVPLIVRIGTDGAVSVFAEGTHGQFNRALAVDAHGNVYWSRAEGMAVYDPRGRLLGLLPGPPDKPAFDSPLGAEFDAAGHLYVLENGDCKRIYEYSFEPGKELPVALDIKPGQDPNTFEPRQGQLQVAILSSDVFDATQVEPSTVRFGATGTEAKPTSTTLADVNGDRRRDQVLEFKVHQTELTCASTSAALAGSTKSGVLFRGTDAVRPEGCGL